MAYVFSLKSKSGLSFEKEEGDGTVDMNDFFNTGEDDDTVCSYFVEFDEDAGVVTFDGEWEDGSKVVDDSDDYEITF